MAQIGSRTGTDRYQFHINVKNGDIMLPIFMQPNLAAYRVYKTTNASMASNTWYHLVVTYDGSDDTANGANRVTMYVDGQAYSTTLTSVGGLGDMQTGTARLALGGEVWADGSLKQSNTLVGDMDQLRIFSEVITAQSVSALYGEVTP